MKKNEGKERFWTALSDPAGLFAMSESEWVLILPALRATSTLGRVAAFLQRDTRFSALPKRVRHLLEEHLHLAERNRINIRYEVNRLLRALDGRLQPPVLLKGAAYIAAGLDAAGGRFSSDLDILVPKEDVERLEDLLMAAGWRKAELAAYDERYYREWMHEIPPLWHPERGITLDTHHTIAPLTARARPRPQELLRAAVPADLSGVKVLCPADMVLHSALHLFNEEFILGLRDLGDIKDLLEHFSKEPGFWGDLEARARLHGLERQLFYLLRYSEFILDCRPCGRPEGLKAVGRPGRLLVFLMDFLVMNAMTPPERPYASSFRGIALWLLYVRSHWLKMPPLLLFKHLLIKSWRRWQWPYKASTGQV